MRLASVAALVVIALCACGNDDATPVPADLSAEADFTTKLAAI